MGRVIKGSSVGGGEQGGKGDRDEKGSSVGGGEQGTWKG